jgi:hypothetical protein
MNNGLQFQNAIRILFCMGAKDFKECFGEGNAPYLWEKFTIDFGKRPDDFICYLDPNNIQLLFDYVTLKNFEQGLMLK